MCAILTLGSIAAWDTAPFSPRELDKGSLEAEERDGTVRRCLQLLTIFFLDSQKKAEKDQGFVECEVQRFAIGVE